MTIWLDAHLPPALANWLSSTFGVTATHLRSLGLRDATDAEIHAAARAVDAIIMTKDADFPEIVDRLGSPPQVIWLRCGNTTNAALRDLLSQEWPEICPKLEAGDAVVEVVV